MSVLKRVFYSMQKSTRTMTERFVTLVERRNLSKLFRRAHHTEMLRWILDRTSNATSLLCTGSNRNLRTIDNEWNWLNDFEKLHRYEIQSCLNSKLNVCILTQMIVFVFEVQQLCEIVSPYFDPISFYIKKTNWTSWLILDWEAYFLCWDKNQSCLYYVWITTCNIHFKLRVFCITNILNVTICIINNRNIQNIMFCLLMSIRKKKKYI